MSYTERKGGKQHDHPLAQVASMLADDMRGRHDGPPHVEPIAWITQHGELFCAACVQPTLAQREDWLGVELDSPGRADRCDLCGKRIGV